MARTPKDVTEAELEVLEVLWQQGACTVRQIVDHFKERGTTVQGPTIQKLLERLENKEWVRRDRSETVQQFHALGNREDLIGQRLQGIAEQLCEGSLTPLINHLVKRQQLSDQDRQTLRDLIEQLDSEATRKSRKKDSGR